jgi:hypothetical protein
MVLNKYSKEDYKYKDLFDGKITAEAIFISDNVKKALKKDIEKNYLRENNIPFSIKRDYLTFLLAFYHYDSKTNNLNQKNTTWDITLVFNNKKYKPSKITKLFRSNHKIFKYYFKNNQRFSTVYLVEFNMLELNKLTEEIKLFISSIEATLKLTWRL